MGKRGSLLVLLCLALGCANAQSPAQPDADGVYSSGAGLALPRITQAAPAQIPNDDSPRNVRHVCVFETVIAADGTPGTFRLVSAPSALDEPALDAVQKSRFEPGGYGKRPVPVRIAVFVPFGGTTQVPILLHDLQAQKRVTIPHVKNHVDAEFSEEARSKHINSTVIIRLTVTENGDPTDIRVVRAAGYGLDEKALEAARQYKFKPAMIDGIASSFPINVTVNFHIG